MKLINIGFGNMVSAGRLIAIVSPESAPIKRMVQEARDKGTLIDATYGRRTRAVLIMDSDHIVLSALQTETVAGRLAGKETAEAAEEEEEARKKADQLNEAAFIANQANAIAGATISGAQAIMNVWADVHSNMHSDGIRANTHSDARLGMHSDKHAFGHHSGIIRTHLGCVPTCF